MLNLSVDPAEKRLGLDVRPDKAVYKPGDSVELRLKAKNAAGEGAAANLAVAVVDVGVINLIGYQTPDPFAAFYGERPLSVETAESRVHVVGQRHFGEKGENAGGGGSEKMARPVPVRSPAPRAISNPRPIGIRRSRPTPTATPS